MNLGGCEGWEWEATTSSLKLPAYGRLFVADALCIK
jgi:hypothetical protein